MEFRPSPPSFKHNHGTSSTPAEAKHLNYSLKAAMSTLWRIAKGKKQTKEDKAQLKKSYDNNLKSSCPERSLFKSKISRALSAKHKRLGLSSNTKSIAHTTSADMHALGNPDIETQAQLDEILNRKAIEVFGPKSWKAAMGSPKADEFKARAKAFLEKREKIKTRTETRSPKADEFKARAKAFLEKREKIKTRTETLQFEDTILKKTLDKVTLDSFQQMREAKRSLYNLRKLFSAVRKVDKEGQQIAFDIHAIAQQEKIRDKILKGEELNEKEQGSTSAHAFEPEELLFVLIQNFKTSLNPKHLEIFDKLSVHGEDILKGSKTCIEVFSEDEVLSLKKKKILVHDAITGRLVFSYPPKKLSAIIQDRKILEARNYKPLMDGLEVHQRLQKRYSIAGSSSPEEIIKRIKKGLQTPRAFLNIAGAAVKTGAKSGGIVESTTLVHPVLGPITLALGVVNIGGNLLNTTADLIQLKQSKDKQKVARKVYQTFKEEPDHKELAAVAKRLKNHHNYREDILGAFVHGNKTLLAVAGVAVGATILGLSIVGTAVSMGIAAPILGVIGGASFSLTAGLISYKLSTWANREIRTSRWKKPHQQLEQLTLCKNELNALRYNPQKELDSAIYKNDKDYKALLEKSEAYEYYLHKHQHTIRLQSGDVTEASLKNEALIFARMHRLEAALPQGAWFDKLIGGAQKLPLIGRSVKCVWGGPHLEKVSQEWNKNIQQAMDWSLIQQQAHLIKEDGPIALNDYQRGLFRMHPSYNACMAEISSFHSSIEAKTPIEKTKAWEDLAVVLLYKKDFKQKLQKQIVKNLENKGIFKGNEALQTRVAELALDLNASKEEAALTLDTLKRELETHLTPEHSDAILANNYEALKAEAFYGLKLDLEKDIQTTLFGKNLIKDLEDAKKQSDSLNKETEESKSPINKPKYFNIESFEQGFSKNRFSKDTAIQEEIKLHYISRSNKYSIATILVHLKQEQSANNTNNFHNINTLDSPWTQFMTDLGASKQDLQAILRSNNDNISQNLLSKIILRN